MNTTNEYENIDIESQVTHGWNWGAFFLTWIWGIFNKSYYTLLVFVPVFQIFWAPICGYKGNKWAWENKEWESVEQFQEVQKKWAIAGLIAFLVPFISSILFFSAISTLISANIPGMKEKEPIVVISDVDSNQGSYMPLNIKEQIDPFASEPRIIVKLENPGRDNPFKPFIQKSIVNNTGMFNEIPPPPDFVSEDPSLKSLVEAKVAGILYDSGKPSAIVKIDGSDYLVHEGDVILDFLIKKIKKKQVLIKTGPNEFLAGIGETVPSGNVNYNNVYNLQNKFGGNHSGTYQSKSFN